MLLDTVKASVIPQFFPANWLDEYPIVSSEFPSRVRIGYVLREEAGYSYVLKNDFDGLGITLAELHDFAITNLYDVPSGRMKVAELPGGTEGFIAADDNFAAARILLPKVRVRLASKLGDQFLITLPHRDWCFFWSLSQPQDRQDKNAAEALEDFIKYDYRLTPDILLATVDGFSLFKEQEPG